MSSESKSGPPPKKQLPPETNEPAMSQARVESETARTLREQDEWRQKQQRLADASGFPEIVDAAEFAAESLTPPPELIAGIARKGEKLALGGGSKTFKTWNLLNLALSIAYGLHWLSFRCNQGRVLFCNFELQRWSFQNRLKTVAANRGVKLESGRMSVWNLRGFAGDYDSILARIKERIGHDYALVILDPLYKLHGSTDENKAGDVAKLLNAIEDLCVSSGAAVAFGHHFSKGNQAAKESIDRFSGSGVFARDPDSLLVFTRHEQDDCFTVESTLRNFKPVKPFVVRWQFPLMQRDDALDPGKLKKARGGRPAIHTVQMVLDCLGNRKLTTTELKKSCADERGISHSRFYSLFDQAKRSGAIIKSGQNKWEVPKLPKVPIGTSGTSGTSPSHNPLGYGTRTKARRRVK
jgi:hypothetical protein